MLEALIKLLTVFWDLSVHYVTDATLFFLTHLLLLGYFFYRWRRSRAYLQDDLNSLKDDTETPELLAYAEPLIKQYAEQGREPDLPRIEQYATDKLRRNADPLRLLINSFVVVGLMGTLFALYVMGSQLETIKGPKDVLTKMSVAFSSSFFGLLWALICNLFLLRYIRKRATQAIQEVGRRLTALSATYPPVTPAHTFELAAQGLNQNVKSLSEVIERLEKREEENLESSRLILAEFRDTTSAVITDLTKKVDEAQKQTALTAEDLRTNVTTSLGELKQRFIEISESWKGQLEGTITASVEAAKRLSTSSENLARATKDVSVSLKAVQISLERTKALAQIVVVIERLTTAYLEQTQEQMTVFNSSLKETVETARTIPDEWFTMLGTRNIELTKGLTSITETWKDNVTHTGEELSSRFDKVGKSFDSLVTFLSPEGQLVVTLEQLDTGIRATKDWLEYKSKTDINLQVDALIGCIENLGRTIDQLRAQTNQDHEGVLTGSRSALIQQPGHEVQDMQGVINTPVPDEEPLDTPLEVVEEPAAVESTEQKVEMPHATESPSTPHEEISAVNVELKETRQAIDEIAPTLSSDNHQEASLTSNEPATEETAEQSPAPPPPEQTASSFTPTLEEIAEPGPELTPQETAEPIPAQPPEETEPGPVPEGWFARLKGRFRRGRD